MLALTDLGAHLTRDARAFERLLATADLTAPVAGCPGWSLAELAGHLGSIHRWATAVVRAGELRPAPDPSGDPLGWYAAGWPPLLAALATADPAAPCWGFGPRPRTTAFWIRRMAHETALHLVDAQRSVGLTPTMPVQLAADGIAEVAEVMTPRQAQRGLVPRHPSTVTLDWGGGTTRLGAGEPVATIHGEPLDLLLLVWRRRPLDGLAVDGDEVAVRTLLETPLTP